MLRAFSFTERYSRTAYSDGPVTFYVFYPGLLSCLRTGTGSINTTDRRAFDDVLREQREREFRIVDDRLPFPMSPSRDAVLSEDVPQPIAVVIKRVPYQV